MARLLAVLTGLFSISFALAAPVPTYLFPKPPLLSFPTRAGTTWTYDGSYGEQTIIISKVEEKDGAKIVTTERIGADGTRTPYSVQRISAEGVFVIAEQGGTYDKPWCLLKLPHRAGQTWETELSGHGTPGVGIMKAGPVEKVKVPAGEFLAARVDCEFKNKFGRGMTATYWYADGYGLVQMDARMKLESFAPGK